MKKTIAVLCFNLALSVMSGQSIGISKGEDKSSDPPSEVANQFKKDHPAFNPIWSREGYNYRADYTDPSTSMAGLVVYDRSGRILRSENELKANSYPGSINDYHTNTLPRATKYKVWSSKDTSGIQSYYTTSDGDRYYFDKDGNYVSGSSRSSQPPKEGKK